MTAKVALSMSANNLSNNSYLQLSNYDNPTHSISGSWYALLVQVCIQVIIISDI